MKYSFTSLALVASASAVVIPRSCTFGITASGEQSGTIGQLDDGQNRIGGDLPPASYSISNGKITDANGRGCILTPPTTQLQCDEGATPTGGFSIGNDGQIMYNGSPTFYACPSSDFDWNLYTTPVDGQDKCVKIELTASGCSSSSSPSQSAHQPSETAPPAGSSAESYPTQQPTSQQPPVSYLTASETSPETTPAPTPTSEAPGPSGYVTATSEATTPAQSPTSTAPEPPSSTGESGESCPTDLGGEYQYPHLIIPVSEKSPDKAYGTSYNGTLSSDLSSIFNFDIPESYTGTCSLVFLFPEQSQLETSAFAFSGDGVVDFKQLETIATSETTYSSVGDVKTDFGDKTVTPGSSTVISTFSCPAGQTVSYELSAVSGTSLDYFQDWNPSPIGLFITTC